MEVSLARHAPGTPLDQESARPFPLSRAPVWVGVLLIGVLASGQWGRGAVTMDDLREVEIAREMAEGRNFVIPHFAGLPFLEKPPGFPVLVALGFLAAGDSEAGIARLISTFFAGVAMLAVFLLALRARGYRTACIALPLFGLAPLFCRVSHEILLDNALTALVALTLYFLWEGWSAPAGGAKRAAAFAAGFTLGLAFLVKGFVGPSIIASGVFLHTALTRRFKAFRSEYLLWFAAAFLIPALAWLVPFCRSAAPEELRTFFIDNHWGRFARAYEGHGRPLYFYLQTLGYKLGWASLVLPLAAIDLWKHGRSPDREPDVFFFSFAAAPMLLLSLSRAKDAVYLLPAYPAFALWAGSWVDRALGRPDSVRRTMLFLLSAGTLVFALGALGWSWVLGGSGPAVWVSFLATGVGILGLFRGWRRSEPALILGAALLLWGSACLLSVSGPVADREDRLQEWPPVIKRLLAESGTADLFLVGSVDELRGGLGFYRRKTATELRSVREFWEHLSEIPGSLGILFADSCYDRALRELPLSPQRGIQERLRIPFRGKTLLVIEATNGKSP